MKDLVILFIRLYQRLAPVRKTITRNILHTDRACRFHPTCSDYMILAVQKYGILKGGGLGVRRILRCHPWSSGGYDPVQ